MLVINGISSQRLHEAGVGPMMGTSSLPCYLVWLWHSTVAPVVSVTNKHNFGVGYVISPAGWCLFPSLSGANEISIAIFSRSIFWWDVIALETGTVLLWQQHFSWWRVPHSLQLPIFTARVVPPGPTATQVLMLVSSKHVGTIPNSSSFDQLGFSMPHVWGQDTTPPQGPLWDGNS